MRTRNAWTLAVALGIGVATARSTEAQRKPANAFELFERPTDTVRTRSGATLALYCIGRGWPTVVLESGVGGGTYWSWHRLQPLIAAKTRVCSYDRAGFGFSRLGADLPRDLEHDVEDLHDVVHRTGERGPVILAGHSMGGELVAAYADRYASDVAALVMLEPAVVLAAPSPPDSADANSLAAYGRQLDRLARCEVRAATITAAVRPTATDECFNSRDFDSLSASMARIELAHESRPGFWRALRSEMENNWSGANARQAAALLPHHWAKLPIRVITAAVSDLTDEELSRALGQASIDRATVQSVRENHGGWEQRQARLCEFSLDCRVSRIHTGDHYVQNAAPEEVARMVFELIERVRGMMGPA
jgi:pimeloyl-ACP methyl ester carboxylesterase